VTNDERLNLRARQILDDPTLSQNERIPNAATLLKQLALNVSQAQNRDAVLSSVTDPDVRAQLDAALAALGA
jgi:hypothetical protein